MHRVFFARNTYRYPSTKSLKNALRAILLTLSLAACLTVLAYRATNFALLELAQYVSAIGALLHAVVVLMLARLIAHAGNLWIRLQREGKRTAELTQLLHLIFRSTGTALFMLLLTIGAACAPLAIGGVMQVPECGLVFILMIVAISMHGANINRTCARIAESIMAAQRASKHTTAA